MLKFLGSLILIPLKFFAELTLFSLKALVHLLWIVPLIFILYPRLNEDVDSNCRAFEIKTASVITSKNKNNYLVNIFGSMVVNESNGGMGKVFAKQQFPNLPPFAGCGLLYWVLISEQNEWFKGGQDKNSLSNQFYSIPFIGLDINDK